MTTRGARSSGRRRPTCARTAASARSSTGWPSAATCTSTATPTCGSGRSTTSTASGAACAEWSGVRWHDRPTARARAPGDAGRAVVPRRHAQLRRARAGARPSSGPTTSRSSPTARPATRREITWAQLADGVARCRAGLRAPRRAARRPGGGVPARTSPRRSSRSSPPRASARSGRRARRSSARARWSTGSRRSNRRCCSRSTATATARRSSTGAPRSTAIEAALPTLRHTVHVPYLRAARADPVTAPTAGARCSPSPGRSSSTRCRSTIRSTCSTARARPGCRRRSCTATAASPSSTSRRSALHHDLGAGDRFFWFTTTGWMMWNYLVSGLLVGATIVLFDGDPGFPDLGALWRLAADTGVDVFGVSAPFLMACRKAGVVPPAASAAQRRVHRRAAAARRLPLGPRRRRCARADRRR